MNSLVVILQVFKELSSPRRLVELMRVGQNQLHYLRDKAHFLQIYVNMVELPKRQDINKPELKNFRNNTVHESVPKKENLNTCQK